MAKREFVETGCIVDTAEAAKRLGVSRETFRRWQRDFSGEIPKPIARVANGRMPLFDWKALEVWQNDSK